MKMIIGWTAILAGLAWPVLQAFVLSRWRGGWRIVASVPVLVGIGGSLYYLLVTHSNLWPFWFVIVAPFSTAFLVILCGVHFLAIRQSR
jgi:hypothetical protein